MPEVICNTSPLVYLHQLGLLHILPELVGHITIPPAVVAELAEGRARGANAPDPARFDWIRVRSPAGASVLRLVTDLGPGEAEVLALAMEGAGSVVVLGNALARHVAETMGIPLTGTGGLLP